MDLPTDLTSSEQLQAVAVADYLRTKCGAYRGSETDAMTDAAHIVRAMRFAPTRKESPNG